MNTTIKYFLILTSLLLPYNLLAYSDLSGSIGYGQLDTTLGKKIDLLNILVGTSFAYGKTFFVGASFEYGSLLRIDSGDDKFGFSKNHKYMLLSPVVGLNTSDLIFKIDILSLGYSKLISKQKNKEITYKDPQGIRITILKKISNNVFIGGFTEHVEYQNYKTKNINEQEITQKIARQWIFSWTLAYVF